MNLLAPPFTTKAMSSVQYKEFTSAMEPQKGGLHSSHFQVQRTQCFSHIFQVSHTPRSVPSFQDPSRSLPMYSDHGSPGPNPQIQSRRILDMGVNGFVFRFTCLFKAYSRLIPLDTDKAIRVSMGSILLVVRQPAACPHFRFGL